MLEFVTPILVNDYVFSVNDYYFSVFIASVLVMAVLVSFYCTVEMFLLPGLTIFWFYHTFGDGDDRAGVDDYSPGVIDDSSGI